MNNYLNTKYPNISIPKVILVVVISLYMFYYLATLYDWHFIDNINLIFHEAGHTIFSFFGEFINILGGTIMQILIPIIFSLYFARSEDYFSASLLLFWLSQNFFNVSVYAGDAAKMQLPLLGGDNVIHDWNYILSTSGLLGHTTLVASYLYSIGIIILIVAIVLSLKFSTKESSSLISKIS